MRRDEEQDPRAELFADWCRLVRIIDRENAVGNVPGKPPSWSFYRDRRLDGTWDDYVRRQARWRGDERYLVAGHGEEATCAN